MVNALLQNKFVIQLNAQKETGARLNNFFTETKVNQLKKG